MEQENAKVQEVNKCDHEEEIQEDKRKRTVTEKGESFRLKGLEDERKAAGVALRKQITKGELSFRITTKNRCKSSRARALHFRFMQR